METVVRIRPWLFVPLAFAATASAQVTDPVELGAGPDPDCVEEVHAALRSAAEPTPTDPPGAPTELPEGRAIAELGAEACLSVLRDRGVPFEALDADELGGVRIPIRLQGPIAGLEITSRGGVELHEILDCRLAVAILGWAPALRAEGVTAIRHYSIYRPGARVARSGRVSGHAKGLAIDVAVVELEDGTEIEVLEGWEDRDRGAAPCEGGHEEGDASAKLRRVVCRAAARELFQVVLTPHYDRAHGNHVHLEVVPGVDWSFVH